jgi:hypothetical protein
MFQELLDVAINPVPKMEYSNTPRIGTYKGARKRGARADAKLKQNNPNCLSPVDTPKPSTMLSIPLLCAIVARPMKSAMRHSNKSCRSVDVEIEVLYVIDQRLPFSLFERPGNSLVTINPL